MKNPTTGDEDAAHYDYLLKWPFLQRKYTINWWQQSTINWHLQNWRLLMMPVICFCTSDRIQTATSVSVTTLINQQLKS